MRLCRRRRNHWTDTMAVLLSNATAQRLLALLGDTRRDPLPPARQPPQRVAVAGGREYAAPWTVRWSATASSYIIYIPSGSARILTAGISTDIDPAIDLTAATDMDDWYTFSGDVGTVYAWVADGEVNIGMSLPSGVDGVKIATIAESDAGAITIQQIARSGLDLLIEIDELLSPSHVLGKKVVGSTITYGWVPTVTHESQHPTSGTTTTTTTTTTTAG